MMKKILSAIACVAIAIGGIGIFGCTPQQQAAVARQLGVAAAVTWIGIDNPSPEDIQTVKTVVGVIKTASCTNCSDGVSYYASVYPIVDKYISEKLQPNQQPMARLGASFVLTSLDTAFALNPSWASNADTARMMIEAFCGGAEQGLSLSATDPVRIAATRQSAMRIATIKFVK